MYTCIFRNLPGPFWVRTLTAIALGLASVLVLMTYVFPVLSTFTPFADSTLSHGR
jgi:hypothetical protein